MTTASQLPGSFESLEPLAAFWAIRGSDARKKRRIASTEEERVTFYNAVAPELARALEYLDRFDIEKLDEKQSRLLDMMLTLAHISLAVESQGKNESFHAISHACFTITRSTEDAA